MASLLIPVGRVRRSQAGYSSIISRRLAHPSLKIKVDAAIVVEDEVTYRVGALDGEGV